MKPRHIAIILDGNRRYARRRGLPPWEGHRRGFKKIKELFRWAIELNITELTLYAFSIQNFSRDKKEVDFLMKIFEQAFRDVLKTKSVFTEQVRVRVIGKRELLPKQVQTAIKKAEDATSSHTRHTVNFCIAYGGREEIIDAVNSIIRKGVKSVTEKTIAENLWLADEPELIIRTSGEVRTSNFFLWQSVYSEWFFTQKTWPEFTKKDLEAAIRDFESRERRNGK